MLLGDNIVAPTITLPGFPYSHMHLHFQETSKTCQFHNDMVSSAVGSSHCSLQALGFCKGGGRLCLHGRAKRTSRRHYEEGAQALPAAHWRSELWLPPRAQLLAHGHLVVGWGPGDLPAQPHMHGEPPTSCARWPERPCPQTLQCQQRVPCPGKG